MHASTESITFNNQESVQMQVGIQNVYGSVHHDVLRIRKKRRYSQVDAELVEHDDAIINSLAFPQMLDRRSNIRQPHPDTCEWIWEHVEFVQWMNSSVGLLWITGKAGAGKSTLMAYLYEHFCKQRDEVTGIYLDFFFSSKGVDLQKSPLGMLRSLLNQLFLRSESTRSYLRAHYHAKSARLNLETHSQMWQQADLERLLQAAILEAAKDQPVTIFIDALDETGDTFAREISAYFHSINDQTVGLKRSVQICLSSRPYPILARVLARQVHVDRCNAHAISLFVNDKLDLASLIRDDDPDREEWQSIRSIVIHQADGLFQWAHLVVSLIHAKISDGEPPAMIHRWLSRVPPELDAVYTQILGQIIERGHRTKSLFLVQCVLFAQCPMSLSDFRYALAAHDAPPEYRERYEEADGFIKSDENMAKLIKTWSGGLIEVKESGIGHKRGNYLITRGRHVLQVTHKSINDFLSSRGLHMLSSTSDASAPRLHRNKATKSNPRNSLNAYKTLYRTCITYIDHERSMYTTWGHPSSALKIRSPFIVHASASLLYYARHAQQEEVGDIAEEICIIQRIYPVWVSIVKQLGHIRNDPNDYIRGSSDPTLFYTACAADLDQVVSHLQSQQDWSRTVDGDGRSAVHVAAMYGATYSATLLHKAGFDFSAVTKDGDTPLTLAAGHRREEFVHWLLEEGAASGSHPTALQAALYPAAQAGNFELLQLLLRSGVDINMLGKDRNGNVASALHFAAVGGYETIVRCLLVKGASADRKFVHLGHIMVELYLAMTARQKVVKILHLLLDAGADVNAYGEDSSMTKQAVTVGSLHGRILSLRGTPYMGWGTALIMAVCMNNKELVKILLDHGADPNIGAPKDRASRDRCILSSSREIVQLLIEAGTKFDESDEAWAENLAVAARHGHREIVEAFFKVKLDSTVLMQACDRALHSAAASGSLNTTQLLLDKGANINSLDKFSRTPLFQAVACGKLEMARYLYSMGASLLARNRWNETPLHVAVDPTNFSQMFSWLRGLGIPLDGQDLWGRTPLHVAINRDLGGRARWLLTHGASPNTRDIYGESPFDYARSRGDYDLIRVMKNGTQVVEENSRQVRRTILQRSVINLASNLLDGTYDDDVYYTPGFQELGRCLLYLDNHIGARQCFQNTFCYARSRFRNPVDCSICHKGGYDQECRQICTVCFKDVCPNCFAFLKCKDSTSGKCYNHDFLIVPAPDLSDYTLWNNGVEPGRDRDMRGAIMDKNMQMLTELINRKQP